MEVQEEQEIVVIIQTIMADSAAVAAECSAVQVAAVDTPAEDLQEIGHHSLPTVVEVDRIMQEQIKRMYQARNQEMAKSRLRGAAVLV